MSDKMTFQERRRILLGWVEDGLTTKVKDFDWHELADEALEKFEQSVRDEEREKAIDAIRPWAGKKVSAAKMMLAIRNAGE